VGGSSRHGRDDGRGERHDVLDGHVEYRSPSQTDRPPQRRPYGRPGVAETIEADLRNLGLVGPILKRLAPELDTSAVLSEVRDLISGELDYEVEAQHQRRLQRMLRATRTSGCHTCTRTSRRAACS
jgi:hypothetical protein